MLLTLVDLPQKSLAFLLTRYCDVEPDKQYQLADWRMRCAGRIDVS